MSLRDTLEQVLDIKGVSSASVVSSDGFMIEGVSHNDMDLSFVGGLLASSLGSSRVLAELLGEGDITQTMIEYDQGPVLLTPLSQKANTAMVVVTLDSNTILGRVRFQLRKVLPTIAEAIAT